MASKRKILLNSKTANKRMHKFVPNFIVLVLRKVNPAKWHKQKSDYLFSGWSGNRKSIFCWFHFAWLTLRNTETMKVGTNLCILLLAVLELSSIFLLLAISKRMELQIPDWRQKMGNLQKFQNLTNFDPIRCFYPIQKNWACKL